MVSLAVFHGVFLCYAWGMEAGRELDERIASEVMGWKRDGAAWMSPAGLRTIELSSFGSFQPSTDMAAAWEVVEKLTEKSEPHFELSRGRDGWHAGFDLDRPFKRVTAQADTAPHAICKAALKALTQP